MRWRLFRSGLAAMPADEVNRPTSMVFWDLCLLHLNHTVVFEIKCNGYAAVKA